MKQDTWVDTYSPGEKRAVLDRLLKAASSPDQLLLSYAQERLWFLDQLAPGKSAYHIPGAVRLRGPFQLRAMVRAVQEVIRRHETLRTTFVTTSAGPRQIVHDMIDRQVPSVDLSELTEERRLSEMRHLFRQESERVFDLSHGSLLRVMVLQLGREDNVIVYVLHHIISDGWSMGILNRETAILYSAFAEGRPSPLPELPVQYVDFAAWQREWLKEILPEQLAYWRRQLEGAPPVLNLPLDRPRPALQSMAGAAQAVNLSAELSSKLEKMSHREGVTLFVLLLTAFKVLLYRYTGQTDIVVGSAISNRNRGEIEGLIGFFVNTLVLRMNLAGDPTFLELLQREKKAVLGAFCHPDLPFEQLVHELQPERSLSHSPLFQVGFTVQNEPAQPPAKAGKLKFEPLGLEHSTAKFDLALVMAQGGSELQGELVYKTDLFDAATIQRMVKHWVKLVHEVVRDPSRRLSQFDLLDEAERRQLITEWNNTDTAYPRHKCIHQLFEEQVEKTPDAIAVAFDDACLNYRELNHRANQLAGYLRRHGVGPELVVGVCFPRSAELVLAMLGILKAGGAYLPLDVAYPRERLGLMLANSGVPLLLTGGGVAEKLPRCGTRVISLGANTESIARESQANIPNDAVADNLAYVMYTSGSTGTPNAIGIPHRAVVRLACHTNYVQLSSSDTVMQGSNISFDAATFEIWGALLNGAKLAGINEESLLTPDVFVRRRQEHEITTMFLTTALFNQKAQHAPGSFKGVAHVLFGGETVDPHWAREVLANDPPGRLLHVYGPTETTTFASWHLVQSEEVDGTVPIGRPISNTQLHVLDATYGLSPVGVAGELYIGGDGLARGYMNRPDLTAEKFIPNPFGQPGTRLYRTGDVVRRRADGNLEFLRRSDLQVKMRGFRIEPGEIEWVLRQHPSVAEAIVCVRRAKDGEPCLTAYVTLLSSCGAGTGDEFTTELKRFAADRLPEYMLPAAFVVLTEFPLNQNGKIDRSGLPDPNDLAADTQEFVAASNPVEAALSAMFCEVLNLSRVSVHANFFELGGHSLKATQLVSRIRETFAVNLPLKDLFQSPSVASLSRLIIALSPATSLLAKTSDKDRETGVI